jgi:arsenite methyltransferase
MGGDKWADWLLLRRDGADADLRERQAPVLAGLRDRVLDGARVGAGDLVLDVGTGDGLIAFGALARGARVIFSDVSSELLELCRDRAGEVLDRCRFVVAAADDLAGVASASVDAVTIRSVLIYVERKAAAFGEFFRVLRPGGRLSIFEPVNSFSALHGGPALFGLDMTPVAGLLAKLGRAYDDEPAMVGFDERSLLLCARVAGFTAIELDYRAEWDVPVPTPRDWAALLNTAPNPLAPTYAEAMAAGLTGAESAELTDYLRGLVEAGAPASRTSATVFLRATRPGGSGDDGDRPAAGAKEADGERAEHPVAEAG